MKRRLAVLLLACALLLAGCALPVPEVTMPPGGNPRHGAPQLPEEVTISKPYAPATPTPPPPTPEPDWKALYAPRLTAYRTVLTDEVGGPLLTELGVNLLCSRFFGTGKALEAIGYAITDIDANGTAELLIGMMPEAETEPDAVYTGELLDVYTLTAGGSIVQVAAAAESDRYWICSDGGLLNEGGDGEVYTYFLLKRLTNAGPILTDGADYSSAAEKPFRVWDGTSMRTATAEEFTEKVMGQRARIVMPALTPFSAYTDGIFSPPTPIA